VSDLQALGLREGSDWEGVVQGRPQHGGEAKPGGITWEVASRKGIGNGVGLFAQLGELQTHGTQEGLVDTYSFTGFSGFTPMEGNWLSSRIQHSEGGWVGGLSV